MPLSSHQSQERRVLDSIESGRPISQRSLSRELGIALGLTNLLLRKMARRGLVRLVRLRRNRVLYLITPAGVAAKTRLSQEYFSRNVRFYRETRDRIRDTFDAVSSGWPDAAPAEKRVAFLGAGEVAEIGFVCLQDTDLKLAAVVDPTRSQPFFGLPVHRPEAVQGFHVNGTPFGRLIVMSFEDDEAVRGQVAACGAAPESIVWLCR